MRTGYQVALLLISSIFLCSGASAQYANETIKKLASPQFQGRGYYKNGDGIAADFIRNEFKTTGLQPVNGNYFQTFTFPVNTFPGKMSVKIGNKKLTPGKDFIVSPACPTIKGEYNITRVKYPGWYFTEDMAEDFILIDKAGLDSTGIAFMDSVSKNPPGAKGVIIVEPVKLTWSVSGKVNDQVFIRILKSSLKENPDKIKLDIESKFIQSHIANNVMGYVPGSVFPDSFIVFTAHYDHLGRMGKKTIFPGANDNASGTAMILDLAKFYSKKENQPRLSVLFLAFAGEEAGLIGSRYYTESPPLPLQKIRFLINLDLMGNGEDGVMVVNGEVFEKEFSILDSLNKEQKLVKEIGKRGKAKNSDHYWFSEKGVPAFFLYTQGGSKAYHDIYDVPKAIKLEEFQDIETLLRNFVNVLLH